MTFRSDENAAVLNGAYGGLAAVYDRFMADVDYDAWADYLERMMRDALPGSDRLRVADCGCGTGSVAVRLLARGMDVTGLDVSPDMLLVAREKLRRAGFHDAPLVCGDMRKLSLHRPVDAVISACDGVNYLIGEGDAERFFRAAHAALKPGGLLLFDISSAYKITKLLDGHTFGEDLEDCAYLWQNVFDPASRLLQMDLSIFVRGADGRYARAEETHLQRAYDIGELRILLGKCGFCGVEVFDAFGTDAPRPDSERIQFLARRGTDA